MKRDIYKVIEQKVREDMTKRNGGKQKVLFCKRHYSKILISADKSDRMGIRKRERKEDISR